MTEGKLEEVFKRTKEGSAGECPLPEPGRGAPVIEHSVHMRTEKQPEGFNYDRADNVAEEERFIGQLRELAGTDPGARAWAEEQGLLELEK